METQSPPASSLYIKMIVSAWETQNTRVDKLLVALSDEELARETANGRNSGIYLLGHLAAVNDNMLPLLGFGEKLHPELSEMFLSNPESVEMNRPTIAQLKGYWAEINAKLTAAVGSLSSEEWLARHTAVSPEDFAKDPTRNKLNILVNRANHQAYHLGQMNYLVKRKF